MFELRQWLKENKHKKSPYGDSLDKNGYAFSLLDMYDGYCFICRKGGDLVRHEVFYGADRDTSKATGCWVYLCPRCHVERVHGQKMKSNGKTYDEELKVKMQDKFEREHSHEDFIELFGENYL